MVTFLKCISFDRCDHCDYSPEVPRNLAVLLMINKKLRRKIRQLRIFKDDFKNFQLSGEKAVTIVETRTVWNDPETKFQIFKQKSYSFPE